MKLSAIMPVFNEEKTVQRAVQNLARRKEVNQVVIVNDGSTDKTAQILQKLKQKFRRKITIVKKRNGGKGSAIRAGLSKVRGNYVIIQDADLEYDPQDIPQLIKPIKEGKATVVFGSRFLGPHSNLLFWHRLGNSFLNLVNNLLYNTTLSDLETCYKVVPTDLMKKLKLTSNDFAIEPEITCKILKKDVRIFETPITYVGRDFSEGKKIDWTHGFAALWTILKIRVTP